MTPLAVIDRYLDAVGQEPLNADAFVALLGADADLLGRWLLLLGGVATPEALGERLSTIGAAQFRELAVAQALNVLTGSGGIRIGTEQWQGALTASFLAAQLAEALALADADAIRWRVLLGLSGVNLPDDPSLDELQAFRGARVELLEDADPQLRIFAVADALDVLDPGRSQAAAATLLGIEPLQFQRLLRHAEARALRYLGDLDLDLDQDLDWSERIWMRIRVSLLGRLFADLSDDAGGRQRLGELQGGVSRLLFPAPPMLLLLDPVSQRLVPLGGEGPAIALESTTSLIARCARLAERVELGDRPDQSVGDRQMLRKLGAPEAICLPLRSGTTAPVLKGGLAPVHGVLLFPLDEDGDDEVSMALYADELGRRLGAAKARQRSDQDALRRFRQQEEKRLRELVHEANNPLSIVQNYLHILQLSLPHEPKAVEQLGLIGGELRRVAGLLGQVREVPDPYDGSSEPAPGSRLASADLNLNDLVWRAVEMHRGYAEARGAQVSSILPPEALHIRSDEQRIMQILTNLLRNGLEAARNHSVRVEMLSDVFREGREGVQLIVADTGPGLPREVLQRLGGPQQSSKGGDHAGLGLQIVHRLVAELTGSLDVRTTQGQGTTFSVFLPLAP